MKILISILLATLIIGGGTLMLAGMIAWAYNDTLSYIIAFGSVLFVGACGYVSYKIYKSIA